MCRILGLSRQSYYYQSKPKKDESDKQQIVADYLAGKPRVEIIREYELTASAFDKWVKQSKTSGSFKEKIKIELYCCLF
ncbi:hypothetical protein EfmJHP35_31150 (plasmid) [Enterococcus faecium]|nr:hypothetical protein EfmJHP35_31150 [Enterococcus faecium]